MRVGWERPGMACQSLVNVEVEVYLCRVVSIRGGFRGSCVHVFMCVCWGGGGGIGYKKSSCSSYHDTEITILLLV